MVQRDDWWRTLPSDALAQQKRQQEADAWAKQQYAELAGIWAGQQTDDFLVAPQQAPAVPDLAAVEPRVPPPPAAPAASPLSGLRGLEGPPPAIPTAPSTPFMGGALVPNQFGDPSLSTDEAYAACGPAAAVAFARSQGRNPSLREALDLAKQVGWTAQGGMNGMGNQQRLLKAMGLEADVGAADERNMAQAVQGGAVVSVSTAAHYFVADAYNPKTGQFHVGASGRAVRRGDWMTLGEMEQRSIELAGGGINGALYSLGVPDSRSAVALPAPPREQSPATEDPFAAYGAGAEGMFGPAREGPQVVQAPQEQPPLVAPPSVADAQRLYESGAGGGANPVQRAGDVAGQATDNLRAGLDAAGGIVAGTDPRLRAANTRLGEQHPGLAMIEQVGTDPGAGIQTILGQDAQRTRENAQAIGPALRGEPVDDWGRVIRAGIDEALPLIGMADAGKFGGAAAKALAGAGGDDLASLTRKVQELEDKAEATASAAWQRRYTAQADELRTKIAQLETPASATPAGLPRALNVRLEKYPEEVRALIEDGHRAAGAQMTAATRGTLPDTAVRELADLAGVNVGQIQARWQPGRAENAENILALREAFALAGRNVLAAQQGLKAGTTGDSLTQMAQALTAHRALQEAVEGVTAEAGRGLRQFRQPVTGAQAGLAQIQRIATATKMTPDELADHLGKVDLTDPTAVAGLARTLTQHTFGDKLTALWYFNLLSSPVTHIKNTASNALVALTRPLESTAAAGFDAALSGGGRLRPRERFFGEVPAQAVGMTAGVQDGVRAAYQILRRGFSEAEMTAKPELAYREPFKGRLADLSVNVPGRALRASDVFFRSINKSATVYAEAYRLASQQGLKGGALADEVARLRANPTPEMLKRAEGEAAYRVFQQDGTFVNKVGGLRSDLPFLKFVVPFVQTPYNIAKYALERTPLAGLKIAQEGVTGSLKAKGAGDLSDRLARVSMGSATGYALFQHAQAGNLTGPAPRDPTERDAFYRQGKQPYSFKTPDGEWRSYAALQPFSTIFAAAAQAADLQERGRDKDALTLGTVMALGISRATLDQPWTDGLAEFLDFLSGANVRNPEDALRATGQYAERQVTSVIPSVMRWVARASDTVVRDPEGAGEALQANIPGLTGNVPARLTAFGGEQRRPQDGLETLNLFAGSPATADPVEQELARLQAKGFDVQPGFVGKRLTAFRTPVELDRDQHRRYQQAAGGLAYALLASLVGTPEWDALRDDEKALVAERVVDRTRAAVREQLEPELLDKAVDERVRQAKRLTP